MEKWCPDLIQPRYLFWAKVQPYLLIVSLTFGYFLFGWAGFFWLGAIRLVYCLHMQCLVNSLLHLKPGLPEGVDSSQNIWWLGPAAGLGLGRELARQSSRTSGVGLFQPSLVAGGYRVVRDLWAESPGPGDEMSGHTAPGNFGRRTCTNCNSHLRLQTVPG